MSTPQNGAGSGAGGSTETPPSEAELRMALGLSDAAVLLDYHGEVRSVIAEVVPKAAWHDVPPGYTVFSFKSTLTYEQVHRPIAVPEAAANNPAWLLNVLETAVNSAKQARLASRDLMEIHMQASGDKRARGAVQAEPDDLLQRLSKQIKVGAPDKFGGFKTDQPNAADIRNTADRCHSFVEEVESYLRLSGVQTTHPSEVQAALAATFLTGHAARVYSADRQRYKTEHKGVEPGLEFFKQSLRTAYIPVTQVADDLGNFFGCGWAAVLRDPAKFEIEAFIQAHKQALGRLDRHKGLTLNWELAETQIMLAGMPSAVYDVCRLNEANEAHISVASLTDQLRKRQSEVVAALKRVTGQDPGPYKRPKTLDSRGEPGSSGTNQQGRRSFQLGGARQNGNQQARQGDNHKGGSDAGPSTPGTRPEQLFCSDCRQKGHKKGDKTCSMYDPNYRAKQQAKSGGK